MTKYQADELLNLAIMEKIPYIIVEGIDDIRIYEEIASSANIHCEIFAIISKIKFSLALPSVLFATGRYQGVFFLY